MNPSHPVRRCDKRLQDVENLTQSGPMTDRAGDEVKIDQMELRKALGAFVTGVTVVTTCEADGTPRGFTANSFTSVSLDPPLVLICIATSALSFPVFQACGHFAINILAEDQTETSSIFASKAPDKFDRAAWHAGAGGSPIIDGAAAWLACAMHSQVEAGDHAILIGRVIDFAHSPSNPLGFCRGSYVNFALERQAVEAAGRASQVGAILEANGKILLTETEDGYALPVGTSLGASSDAGSLIANLDALGIRADISFLYAVFESGAGRELSVYYRGDILEGPAPGAAASLVAFDDVPFDKLPDNGLRDLVRRYISERVENRFGIYVGDSQRGKVQTLSDEPLNSPGWS